MIIRFTVEVCGREESWQFAPKEKVWCLERDDWSGWHVDKRRADKILTEVGAGCWIKTETENGDWGKVLSISWRQS